MTAIALLLGMALVAHLSLHLNAVPTLEGPLKMIGAWKGSINISCTYHPMESYTQVLVKWLVQQDGHPATIFLRDFSGDHIQQSKYRGRLQVSRETPGDVSLRLDSLEMDDRGRYLCQVTWKGPDDVQRTQEKITELQVQKIPASKPQVTTGSGYGFVVPQGMRISLLCQAQGSPPITYKWYKGEAEGSQTQVAALGTLLFKPAVVSDSGTYFCVAKARIGDEQRSDPVQFLVTDSSKRPTSERPLGTLTARTTPIEVIHQSIPVTPTRDRTSAAGGFSGTSTIRSGPTSGFASRAQDLSEDASQRSGGQGLPLYAIILIISLCMALVFAMVSAMFRRRKSQHEHTYEVARMSTGDGPKVSIYSGGTAEVEADAKALENEYHDDPTLNQDYQIITQANSDYAQLLYESSSVEFKNGKTSC